MTTITAQDFTLHVQAYLEQAVAGEQIRVQLNNETVIALIAEPVVKQALPKRHTRADFLNQLSYQGSETDSQATDAVIYS